MAEQSYKQKIAASSDIRRGSLLSRIGASTSALTRATIVQIQPTHIGESLITISSASSKSGPSSGIANQRTFSRGETSEKDDIVSGSRVNPLLTESFRTFPYSTSTSTTSLQHEFDMFSAVPTTNPALFSRSRGTYTGAQSRHGKQRRSWVGDGAEVVDLLSDPSFFLDDLPDPSVDAEPFDDYPELWKPDVDRMSSYEIGNGLTAPPVHHTPSPTNPLNLSPDFDFGYSVSSKSLMTTVPVNPMNVKDGLCSRSSADSSSTNFKPWLDVLTRYQDDVWGDMLPLVKEARAELKIASAEGGTPIVDRPAIKRLGMILGHFNDFSGAAHLQPSTCGGQISVPITLMRRCQFKSDP
ncbi:hypothetical protein MMC18_000872 [Xylographa bjoerkii]|nr:hypothetical protein [Xylographa bjoerkii]